MQKLLFVMGFLAAVASGQQSDQRKLSVDVDFVPGLTIAAPKTVLNPDWQQSFVPPKEGMTLGGSTHPVSIGAELRVVRILRRPKNGWQIGVPLSFRLLNGSIYGRGGRTYYLGQQGVSGTYLRWWNTVLVNDIIVQNFSPRIGLEIAKGRFSITPSVQHYRLSARDYVGKDCVGCRNTSSVTTSRQMESGISPRLEVMFARAGDNPKYAGTPSLGFYVENSGAKVWGSGFILRWKLR